MDGRPHRVARCSSPTPAPPPSGRAAECSGHLCTTHPARPGIRRLESSTDVTERVTETSPIAVVLHRRERSKRRSDHILRRNSRALAATAFTNVQMHLRPMKDIRIKRVRQVVPEIKELKLDEPEERHLIAELGTLEHDKTSRYVIDLSLPKRADGKYVIAQLEVTYDVGTDNGDYRAGAAGDDVHGGRARLHQRRGCQAHRRGADF